MSDQTTVMGRIGQWFKRGGTSSSADGASTVYRELPLSNDETNTAIQVKTARTHFFAPWRKRDVAISNLQQGFTSITQLMVTVRDNLERQSERQDELLKYLSHLPEALTSIPESNRVQGEALKAINQQLAYNHVQQDKLSDILERLNVAGGDQKAILEAMRQRVDKVDEHSETISENLSNVGEAMQNVSRSSQNSAQVLVQLRDNLDARDGELERILHRHNTRLTAMLAAAIILSLASLTVGIFVFLNHTSGTLNNTPPSAVAPR